MSKKQIKTTAIANELAGASLYFTKPEHFNKPKDNSSTPIPARKEEQISTSKVTGIRNPSRDFPLEKSRGKPRDLPTRDAIQEFSFQLRDELKVKVQAEVPYGWQTELEEVARQLRVKKLELYRFIIGEFLGKLKQEPTTKI
jgi:hypothetical protein